MTFSEFGRRIQSNESGGTDDGAAAPVFVFGEGVQGGIIGENPVFPERLTVNDNLTMQTDFRAIYATMLEKWFGTGAGETAVVLMRDYPNLALVKSAIG